MDTYFSWEFIGTLAGCTAATALITEFLKAIFDKLPTQLLSYIVAVILMVGATVFTSGFSLQSLFIIPINAIIVSLASNGSFDAVKNIRKS